MAKTYDIDAGTIRRVDWLELVPLTLFFRAFAATFKPSYLLLGAFLITLTSYVSFVDYPTKDVSSRLGERVDMKETFPVAHKLSNHVFAALRYSTAPARRLYNVVSSATPGTKSSISTQADRSLASYVIRFVSFFVTAWLALAISRTAVVRLTTTSRSSTIASLKFATKRLPSAFLTIVAPLCFLLALWVVSFLARTTGVVGTVLAPVVALLLISFEALFLILVLAAPLGFAAIGAENCDGFDAISRGVSYLVQRSLIWALYALVAQILIFVGCFVVAFVSSFASLFYVNSLDVVSFGWNAFWRTALANIPVVYAYVAAVVYSNAIYVQLRRSVDGTPFDSCVLNLKGMAPRKLRKILKDGKGAPTFDAQLAETTADGVGKQTETPESSSLDQEGKS